MNQAEDARIRVFRYLYGRRIEEPNTYFGRNDLAHLAEPKLLAAAISFGKEMGYLQAMRKHYRLTANGMLYVESLAGEE
jgi:hypothetical protein